MIIQLWRRMQINSPSINKRVTCYTTNSESISMSHTHTHTRTRGFHGQLLFHWLSQGDWSDLLQTKVNQTDRNWCFHKLSASVIWIQTPYGFLPRGHGQEGDSLSLSITSVISCICSLICKQPLLPGLYRNRLFFLLSSRTHTFLCLTQIPT